LNQPIKEICTAHPRQIERQRLTIKHTRAQLSLGLADRTQTDDRRTEHRTISATVLPSTVG